MLKNLVLFLILWMPRYGIPIEEIDQWSAERKASTAQGGSTSRMFAVALADTVAGLAWLRVSG